jgi:cellulose synthase/poly-beta-1,6-N-acetylglucosamine synthase-like glycosyltransferase
MSLRALCFWSGAAGAGWVLAGYPATLLALPARPTRRATGAPAEPAVTIVVPAYREREALAAKLTALRELDYPAERVQVVVAVDEDPELAQVAERTAPEGSRVLFSPERGGKAAGLNRALEVATGDVVVMTDANNILDAGSIRAAVRHFADPDVVAVAGRRSEASSAYDRYEDLLRRLESRSGSVAALSGEFMAVRRERLGRFPEGVVNDDLWLLCQLVREGGRVVYEPEASSSEPEVGGAAELARRSRIGAGRVMLLGELRGLPVGFATRLLSHKFGRLVLPFMLLATLAGSLSLSRRRHYRAVAAAQVGAYGVGGLAVAGLVPPGPAGRVARALGQLLLGNVAVARGVVRGLRGRQGVLWEPVR